MFPRASLRQGLIKIIPNAAAGILARKKVEKKPQIKLDFLFYLIFLRRDRDSNPGYLSVQRFSRPPQSTTLPPLQNFYQEVLFSKSAAKVRMILISASIFRGFFIK